MSGPFRPCSSPVGENAPTVWSTRNDPILVTHRGVEANEILQAGITQRIVEGPVARTGGTWRRLAVTFPPWIATHKAKHVWYYDEHFMQR